MLKAINKKTGKMVSAFKVENDPSWLGTEKEEWIAPRPEISNWNFLREKNISEVKVAFVKSHIRDLSSGKSLVSAHFRCECEHAITNQESESEEHRLAKEAIYEQIVNNNILVEGKSIKELGIDDLDFEYRLSKSKKSKIADVILIFKKEHERFGKGIVFEVQFSNQNHEITEERTYDRIIEGYSVVWLWEGDFEDNKLKNKEVLVVPFSKAIKEYQELIKSEWEEKSRYYGLLFEEKVKKEALNFDTLTNKRMNQFEEKSKKILEEWDKMNETYQLSIKAREQIEERRIQKSSFDFMERMNKFVNEKLSEGIFLSHVASLIDYKKITSYLLSEEVLNGGFNEQLIVALQNELQKVQGHIGEIILKRINEDIIPKIEKDYKTSIKGEVFCQCRSCQNNFPIRSMDYKDGWAYCSDCYIKEVKNENKVHQGQQNL